MSELVEEVEVAEDTVSPSDETVEVTAVESEVVSPYAELAVKYKTGEELSDEETDTIVDLAVSILRELLAHFDAADSPIDEYEGDDGEVILDVTAPNLAVLIGRHGRTLESLQTMFSLLVSRKLGFRFPVMVDIEGYKSRRHDKVIEMAERAAGRAIRQQTPVSLSPMTAYERRLVHLALRDNARVETHSEGVDPERHVVVVPL